MTASKRESRRDIEMRQALEHFCLARRDGARLEAWVAWYTFRSLHERWQDDLDGPERTEAYRILAQAEGWQRGFRPPTSFHEANGRIRKMLRAGRLRGGSGGL